MYRPADVTHCIRTCKAASKQRDDSSTKLQQEVSVFLREPLGVKKNNILYMSNAHERRVSVRHINVQLHAIRQFGIRVTQERMSAWIEINLLHCVWFFTVVFLRCFYTGSNPPCGS